MRLRRAARLAIIALFLVAQASAKTSDNSWPMRATKLAPESRVRVTASPSPIRRAVGWVHHWTADSLVIRLDSGPSAATGPLTSFHRTSVTRLETSDGVKGHTVRGAFLGFFVGSVVGFFVTEAVVGKDADLYGTSFDGEAVLAAWGGTVVLTTVLGGLIGSTQKSERWNEVSGF